MRDPTCTWDEGCNFDRLGYPAGTQVYFKLLVGPSICSRASPKMKRSKVLQGGARDGGAAAAAAAAAAAVRCADTSSANIGSLLLDPAAAYSPL